MWHLQVAAATTPTNTDPLPHKVDFDFLTKSKLYTAESARESERERDTEKEREIATLRKSEI